MDPGEGVSLAFIKGPLPGEAVLSPRWDDDDAFDSAILGCSCVLRVKGEWRMYYSGGVQAGSPLASAGSPVPGFPMRGGLATSSDGVVWTRVHGSGPGGCILDVGTAGEHDERYIGWPSVVQLADDRFVMIYHSAVFMKSPSGASPAQFSLARAVSSDGIEWQKTGLCVITGRDESPDAFDVFGMGTRDVVQLPGGELLMYAEGVNAQGQHNIAALRSQDEGQTWHICNNGQALINAVPGSNVGTACVVRPSGEASDDWWVYCVATQRSEAPGSSFSIALAQSSSGPEGPFTWYQGSSTA